MVNIVAFQVASYVLVSLKVIFRMPYYAVKVGRSVGIFKSWFECQREVSGFKGAVFKKFETMCGAEEFLKSEPKGTEISVEKRQYLDSRLHEIRDQSSPPLKKCKELKIVDSSAVDSLLPVPFMHDLHEANKVLVYVDGSCKGPPDNRRAGIGVFWGVDHPWNISERLKGRQTNNRAEIEACIKALQQANTAGIKGVKIVTDSKFTINCATVWYFKWQRNGWKLANGNPVLHRRDIERLVDQLATPGLKVAWCHSPGHCGKWGNEQADRLANNGADLPYTYGKGDEDCDDNDGDFTEADV